MAATPSQTGASSHVNLGGTVTSSFDSPSHAALAAVGMEHTSSSNAMNLSLSGLGLNNMSMLGSLSQGMLGGGSSMGLGHKLDDAERRRKLESVLNTLGASAGRISQEGVERLARRMGLEIYDETREGARSLMIAGKSVFAVDVSRFPYSLLYLKSTSIIAGPRVANSMTDRLSSLHVSHSRTH